MSNDKILEEYVTMLQDLAKDAFTVPSSITKTLENTSFRTMSHGDYILFVHPEKSEYVLFSKDTSNPLKNVPVFTEIKITNIESSKLKKIPSDNAPNPYNIIELQVKAKVYYKKDPFYDGNFKPQSFTLYMLPVNVSFTEIKQGLTSKIASSIGSAIGVTYTASEKTKIDEARNAFITELTKTIGPIKNHIETGLPQNIANNLQEFLKTDAKGDYSVILTELNNQLISSPLDINNIKQTYNQYKKLLNLSDTTDLKNNEAYLSHYRIIKTIHNLLEKNTGTSLTTPNNLTVFTELYKLLPDLTTSTSKWRTAGEKLTQATQIVASPLTLLAQGAKKAITTAKEIVKPNKGLIDVASSITPALPAPPPPPTPASVDDNALFTKLNNDINEFISTYTTLLNSFTDNNSITTYFTDPRPLNDKEIFIKIYTFIQTITTFKTNIGSLTYGTDTTTNQASNKTLATNINNLYKEFKKLNNTKSKDYDTNAVEFLLLNDNETNQEANKNTLTRIDTDTLFGIFIEKYWLFINSIINTAHIKQYFERYENVPGQNGTFDRGLKGYNSINSNKSITINDFENILNNPIKNLNINESDKNKFTNKEITLQKYDGIVKNMEEFITIDKNIDKKLKSPTEPTEPTNLKTLFTEVINKLIITSSYTINTSYITYITNQTNQTNQTKLLSDTIKSIFKYAVETEDIFNKLLNDYNTNIKAICKEILENALKIKYKALKYKAYGELLKSDSEEKVTENIDNFNAIKDKYNADLGIINRITFSGGAQWVRYKHKLYRAKQSSKGVYIVLDGKRKYIEKNKKPKSKPSKKH